MDFTSTAGIFHSFATIVLVEQRGLENADNIVDNIHKITFSIVTWFGLFFTSLPVRLHEYSRTEILVRVPPVAGTRRGATRTQDTLI